MLVHIESQFQLCTDAIGAADQHRVFIFILVEREKSAKAAEPADHFRTLGALDVRLYEFYRRIACVDVDAGVFIGNGFLFHRYSSYAHFFQSG